MNLVRVAKAEDEKLPFKSSTLYHWHHRGKHPELFIKVDGGALFIDLDAFKELLESMRGRKVKEVVR